MIDIFDYKVVYFAISLLLGFILGYLINKKNAEYKVSNDLTNLEKKYKSSQKKLDIQNDLFFDTKNRYQVNKDIVQTQSILEEKSKNNINNYKQKLISLQEARKDLEEQESSYNQEISYYKKNLQDVKLKFSSINNLVKNYERLRMEKDEFLLKIEELKTLENKLESNKKLLEEKLKDFKNKDILLDSEIIDLKNKIFDLQEKKKLLKNNDLKDIDKELENTRTKMLNYKYKLEDVEQRLSKGLKVDREDLVGFIHKNEEERFIDRVFNKLFKNLDIKD